MIVSGAMGFCSVDAQLIAVAEDLVNDAMQDKFLHEVMHALTAAFDLKEKDKEESFVRRLATGICTVWNDNPKAFKWWRSVVCRFAFSPVNRYSRLRGDSNVDARHRIRIIPRIH